MPDTCVVPGCKSNYKSSLKTEGYIQSFLFPKDPTRRELWLRAIRRPDWTPTRRSCVCIKHFRGDDLILTEKYKIKGGDWREYRREKPFLSKNAVPELLITLPSYHDGKQSVKRKGPEKRKKEEAVRIKEIPQDNDIGLLPTKENEVEDVASFCQSLPSKINRSELYVFKNDAF